ncbi:hypothetical protein A5N86_15200 [Geobacillus thermoleovorans]|nr:hypothetical protein A5N86_15200 [Geobacillus thermoleovorans]
MITNMITIMTSITTATAIIAFTIKRNIHAITNPTLSVLRYTRIPHIKQKREKNTKMMNNCIEN